VLSTSVPWPALRHELACEERAAVVADQNGRASMMMTSQVGPKSDGSCFATYVVTIPQRYGRTDDLLYIAIPRSGPVESMRFYGEFGLGVCRPTLITQNVNIHTVIYQGWGRPAGRVGSGLNFCLFTKHYVAYGEIGHFCVL